MASLHRRPDSKFWFAAWRQGGRLFLRSTKQTHRSSAMEIALKWERASKLAEQGLLTEHQARKILDDILLATNTGDRLRSMPTREFFRNWLETKDANKSPGTATRYATTVGQFLRHIGSKAERPLSALTSRDFQAYFDARRRSGVAASTAIVDIKTLVTAMNSARRQGFIPANPAEAVERPERIAGNTRGLLNPGEIERLVDEAKGTDWATCILLGAYTGQRLGDLARLRWDQVDLVEGEVRFEQRKTGQRITVPIHPALQSHLETKASSDRPDKFVCPDLADKPVSGRNGLSRRFTELMQKAGVNSEEVTGMRRRFSARSFHSLRHSFNSLLADAGVPQEKRMRLTGHRSERVNDAYTKPSMEVLRAALEKLPRFGS